MSGDFSRDEITPVNYQGSDHFDLKSDTRKHSRNESDTTPLKDRYQKRDKQKSVKRKRLEKQSKYNSSYDNFMNHYIPRSINTRKSPVLLINKSFNKIKKNSIILHKSKEMSKDNQRQINYEVYEYGSSINKVEIRGSVVKLFPENTKNNVIFILVPFKEASKNPNLVFYTENGVMLSDLDVPLNDSGSVLIATVQFNREIQQSSICLSDDELKIAHKHFYNQVSSGSSTYHFGTAGTIFGFGYGPKYRIEQSTGSSIGRFTKSKLNLLSSTV